MPAMTDLRDRYDRFAAAFGVEVRRAAGRAADQDQYWKAVQDLFTRDVTGQGLRDLVEHETRETYRFFTRELDLSDLEKRPWYERIGVAAWRVFEAMAYRLHPARRILFAVAVPLLLLGFAVYLLEVAAHGGFPLGFFRWDGLLIASAALILFLLLMELRDKLGLKSDLEVARQIQFGLLPFEPWERGGFTVRSAMRPANTVGGDYFDVVELGEGRLGVVIGDVAGKGMPAALLMALLQGSLRTLLTAGLRGCELMAKLNAHLFANIPSNRLVTLFYGELDPASGAFAYVNAGHNPPVLVRHGGPLERLTATAVALGVVRETAFEAREARFAGGDRLFLYTDGLTEAENALEEEFGEGRLLAFLEAHRRDGDQALLDGAVANVLLFGGGVKPRDDMTLMVVSRLASPVSQGG
jgi:serine phosphatase RsbU (regulator of sigma subunit)